MLYLSKTDRENLIKHAREGAPDEVCGILAGTSGEVKKIYSMTNKEKSPETFLMDPEEQFKVMKEIRRLGLEMIGIYHSHAHSKAYPSAHDVELAFYPEVSYVIVSLEDKNNPSVRSFRIIEGKITEEEIKIK